MTTCYRQVLVHLDPTRAVQQRLEAALRVAGQNGAALTALYAATPSLVELAYAPEVYPLAGPDLAKLDDERRQLALDAFNAVAGTAGPQVRWSETSDPSVARAFARQAFYADLAILGQRDPGDGNASCVPDDFVQTVVLLSGRAALVLPYVKTTDTIGQIAVIAWKPTPEAARAVTAALPFLQRAQHVHVLAWGGERPLDAVDGDLDLTSYLRAHGIETHWHAGGPEPGAIGELMLSRVFDLGADLLVMGCFSHSRAREWILGGATRTVLASMTVPVLMAH